MTQRVRPFLSAALSKSLIVGVAWLLIALLSPSAFANSIILNGGFESGLSSWTTAGTAGATGTIGAFAPSSGNFQGYAHLFPGDPQTVELLLADGTSPLLQFLGLTDWSVLTQAGVAAGEYTGSAIKQTFAANAGDVLSFRWNFATDSAVGVLEPADSGGIVTIAGNGINLMLLLGADDQLGGTGMRATGYQSAQYTIPMSGQYTLGMAAADNPYTVATSYMFLDDVDISPVPEPATLLLLGTGLAVAAARRRFTKRT